METTEQNTNNKEIKENIEYEKILNYHKIISTLLFLTPLAIVAVESSSNYTMDPTSFTYIRLIVGILIEISTSLLFFLCKKHQIKYYGKTIITNLFNLVPIIISLLILDSINNLHYLYLNNLLTIDRLNLELFSKGGIIYIIPAIIMFYVVFKILNIQNMK